jgi:hypothetical protein
MGETFASSAVVASSAAVVYGLAVYRSVCIYCLIDITDLPELLVGAGAGGARRVTT